MNKFSNPLGLVRNIIEAMGLEVTYAFDDLIFVDHHAFLLQMDENPEQLNLYFNQESEASAHAALEKRLAQFSKENGLIIVKKGLFKTEQEENETFRLTFY